MAIDSTRVKLNGLIRISRMLGASQNTDDILPKIVAMACDLTGANRGVLTLLGEETRELKVYIPYNLSEEALNDEAMLSSRRLIDEVIERGRGAIGGDVRSSMCIPLLVRDDVIGVLYVDNLSQAGIFTEGDMEILDAVAECIAATIENTRLVRFVQETVQAKEKFISVLSHELRIPMTSILGYSDLMRQGAVGPVNEQQVGFLNIIRNNVERMSVLVSNLSDLSKVESGRLELDLVPVSLNVYLEKTLQDLRSKMEQKNQVLSVELSPDLPHTLAEPNRMVQVVDVLLDNAWKYTPDGGQIQIIAFPRESHIHLEVIDNGIGIDEQDQKALFSPFFRSENPAVREVPGWGLGLSLASQLVRLMDGDLGFDSALGEGSKFWIRLQIAEK